MTSITATDPWLRPYANHIAGRQSYIRHKKKELLGSNASLEQTVLGHLYYGLHQTDSGWIFREWAPNATRVFLTGTMTNWQDDPAYELQKTEHGNWEITLSTNQLRHGDLCWRRRRPSDWHDASSRCMQHTATTASALAAPLMIGMTCRSNRFKDDAEAARRPPGRERE